MKLIFKLSLVLLLSNTFIAGHTQNEIVVTINDERIPKNDFEKIFRKNNRDSVITTAALDDYMALFINFKLKVQDAEKLGLDTAAAFIAELKGYRKQLARPYLTDSEMLDALVNEAYERSLHEIRASHILIKCPEDASPADTLAAYKKIMTLRKKIVEEGLPFDEVAAAPDGSQDPSAKENKGDLGYFTAFQMVYPFETCAYNTAVGEVSMPVRSSFGYHLVKVTDKRPAQGEIKVAHIMIQNAAPLDSLGEKANTRLIQDIYDQLEMGEDFEILAMQYSEDQSSAKDGGELAWFGTSKMVPEFEAAAFGLKENGDYSMPFKTMYGWHIVKRLDYRAVATYDQAKKSFKSKVSKDVRAEITQKSFIEKLKKSYHYKLDDKLFTRLSEAADSSIFEGKLSVDAKDQNKALFVLDGQNFMLADFLAWLPENGKPNGKSASEYLAIQLDQFSAQSILDYEDQKLESKYDDFRLLVEEYHDGILLFELTDQKVWTKAVQDSAGLENFYTQHQNLFMWEPRIQGTMYKCIDQLTAMKVTGLIKEGKTPDEIAEALNVNTDLNLQFKTDVFKKSTSDLFEQMPWEKGIHTIAEDHGRYTVVQVNEVIPQTPKKLEDARGLVAAEYQKELEKEWIAELLKNSVFTINKEVLHSIQ